MTKREQTRPVFVGSRQLGGTSAVLIQSMTNTKTKNIPATIAQIDALARAGCAIARVAVLDQEDALAIGKIKAGITIPLVADIHFDYRLALEAIRQGVDKIRINPGNIGGKENVAAVVFACKEKHIPIRIGINSGSLEKHILAAYGKPTPAAMLASASYHVGLLEALDFQDIVISLKASSIQDTIMANRLAAAAFAYPLHLGITEAGTAFSGTIRSAIGLGVLLEEGIGSTIRVSLTADPLAEIKVAKEILANFNLYAKPILVSCPTCGRIEYDMIKVAGEIEAFLETVTKTVKVAIMGCVVNGPGEARDADIALCGGKDAALLYVDGQIVRKLNSEEIVPVLKQVILDYPET